MWRNRARFTLLLLVVLLLCSACVPLRTLGPAIPRPEARVPDVLLGPYNPPAVVEPFVSMSDHLRDLQASGALKPAQKLTAPERVQFVSSSDHLRDLQAAGKLK